MAPTSPLNCTGKRQSRTILIAWALTSLLPNLNLSFGRLQDGTTGAMARAMVQCRQQASVHSLWAPLRVPGSAP